jgi:A/G-specific adenine glycosylase
VLSIAYGEPLAAVDGNVARVLARLDRLGLPDARGEPHASLASRLLARRRPGDWNQAMMELGQVICTPRAPRCEICPIREPCRAARDGAVAAHPPVKPRRAAERHAIRLAVLRDRRGEVALERGAFAHLPRMWLPLLDSPRRRAVAHDPRDRRDARRGLRRAGSFRHAIAHRVFDVEVHAGVLSRAALERAVGGGRARGAERRLFTRRELGAIGRSSLLTKAIDLADGAWAPSAARAKPGGSRPRR